jgi:hypothetical protein
MKLKIKITAFLLCATLSGFAQNQQIRNNLSSFKSSLNRLDSLGSYFTPKSVNQFLLQQEKVPNFVSVSARDGRDFRKVFDALMKSENIKSSAVFEAESFNSEKNITTVEVKMTVEKGQETSVTRNRLTLGWRESGSAANRSWALSSVGVKPLMQLTSEVQNEAQRVLKVQDEVFKNYLFQLNAEAPSVKFNFPKRFNFPQQFFIEDNKVDTLLGIFNTRRLDYTKDRSFNGMFNNLLTIKDSLKIEVTYFPIGNPKFDVKRQIGTTESEVLIVVSSHDGKLQSITRNKLTLSWNIKVNDDNSIATPTLTSIEAKSINLTSKEKEELKNKATELLGNFYADLESNFAKISDEYMKLWFTVNTLIEKGKGNIVIEVPQETVVIKSVPTVIIRYPSGEAAEGFVFVEPTEHYREVQLTFTIDPLVEQIANVEFKEIKFVKPEEKARPQENTQPQVLTQTQQTRARSTAQVPTGKHYKVQILARSRYIAPDKLPKKFRIEGLEVEKFQLGNNTMYQYVVPAGSLREARALRQKLINEGHPNAWITGYVHENRIQPNEGTPLQK